MKRVHIGLAVKDLEASIRYYSTLFGVAPVVQKSDYAKWAPNDPPVNFSISTHCGEQAGDVHFGVEATEKGALGEVGDRLEQADFKVLDEGETICCYHRSTKSWSLDPDGNRWEIFLTKEETAEFGSGFDALEEARSAQAKAAGE